MTTVEEIAATLRANGHGELLNDAIAAARGLYLEAVIDEHGVAHAKPRSQRGAGSSSGSRILGEGPRCPLEEHSSAADPSPLLFSRAARTPSCPGCATRLADSGPRAMKMLRGAVNLWDRATHLHDRANDLESTCTASRQPTAASDPSVTSVEAAAGLVAAAQQHFRFVRDGERDHATWAAAIGVPEVAAARASLAGALERFAQTLRHPALRDAVLDDLATAVQRERPWRTLDHSPTLVALHVPPDANPDPARRLIATPLVARVLSVAGFGTNVVASVPLWAVPVLTRALGTSSIDLYTCQDPGEEWTVEAMQTWLRFADQHDHPLSDFGRCLDAAAGLD